MGTVITVIAVAFVIVVLALFVFALFEMSPLASHGEELRDPRTGHRIGSSPHLD